MSLNLIFPASVDVLKGAACDTTAYTTATSLTLLSCVWYRLGAAGEILVQVPLGWTDVDTSSIMNTITVFLSKV
jgi:hypothetical protein